MKISIVIPLLNEEQALPATFGYLHQAAVRYPDIEILAVDGGSDDGSVDWLRTQASVRLLFAARGRARQMNAGAASATGDVLLFLHADTWLPEDGLAAIAAAASRPEFVYGGFHQRFSGKDWRLAVISALHNFRCRKAQTFYGDQALFVRRSAFVAAGGFPDQLVEDIALSQRLRAVAPAVFLPQAVITSARKFHAMGVWASFGRVLTILLCLRFGIAHRSAFFADVR